MFLMIQQLINRFRKISLFLLLCSMEVRKRVCVPSTPLVHIDELDNCSVIFGNLEINEQTNLTAIDTNLVIEDLVGCIYITLTDAWLDLTFLTKIRFKFGNYCNPKITTSQAIEISVFRALNSQFQFHGNFHIICNEIQDLYSGECNIVPHGVRIYHMARDVTQQNYMTLTKSFGEVEISDIFLGVVSVPNLEYIYDVQGPALLLSSLPMTTDVYLPSLKTIGIHMTEPIIKVTRAPQLQRLETDLKQINLKDFDKNSDQPRLLLERDNFNFNFTTNSSYHWQENFWNPKPEESFERTIEVMNQHAILAAYIMAPFVVIILILLVMSYLCRKNSVLRQQKKRKGEFDPEKIRMEQSQYTLSIYGGETVIRIYNDNEIHGYYETQTDDQEQWDLGIFEFVTPNQGQFLPHDVLEIIVRCNPQKAISAHIQRFELIAGLNFVVSPRDSDRQTLSYSFKLVGDRRPPNPCLSEASLRLLHNPQVDVSRMIVFADGCRIEFQFWNHKEYPICYKFAFAEGGHDFIFESDGQGTMKPGGKAQIVLRSLPPPILQYPHEEFMLTPAFLYIEVMEDKKPTKNHQIACLQIDTVMPNRRARLVPTLQFYPIRNDQARLVESMIKHTKWGEKNSKGKKERKT